MNWFRFYHEVLDDPKVQKLHPSLFKHWVNLLCLASESSPRGQLPGIDAIAFRLRLYPHQAAKIVDTLVAAGLLDMRQISVDDSSPTRTRLVFFPHGWESRQSRSDNVAERVARHRSQNKNEKRRNYADSGENVTLHETLPVTAMKHGGNVLDRERERDTERERPPSPPNGAPPPMPPSGKATYVATLNSAFDGAVALFAAVDERFTRSWLSLALVEAESHIGKPLPRDKLGRGLKHAKLSVEEGLRNGHIHNAKAFARSEIIKSLKEQASE